MAKKNGTRLARKRTSCRETLGFKTDHVIGLVKAIRKGISFTALERFEHQSGLGRHLLARAMGIPPRTMARRKAGGTLTSDESERLLRLAELFDLTVALFEGNRAAARNWLQAPNKALGNLTPLTMAETALGARAVEDLIGRLEAGVYS